MTKHVVTKWLPLESENTNVLFRECKQLNKQANTTYKTLQYFINTYLNHDRCEILNNDSVFTVSTIQKIDTYCFPWEFFLETRKFECRYQQIVNYIHGVSAKTRGWSERVTRSKNAKVERIITQTKINNNVLFTGNN